MNKRALITILAAVLVLAVCLPALAAKTKMTMAEPVISLDRVEVQSYFGFWHGTKEEPAAKGSCPLVMAFVFNVMNPNSIPVELEQLKFTFAFDGYDIDTPQYNNTMWIPAGKTTQVRVVSTLATGTVAGNLAVTSGFKMKDQGHTAGDLLKKWWEGAPDASFPITVSGGVGMFSYEGGSLISAFMGKFGGM